MILAKTSAIPATILFAIVRKTATYKCEPDIFVSLHTIYRAKISDISDLSRPPGRVITPSFHATPNHLKFKGGYQGGVYGGVYVIVMEWVINVVKY